MVTGAEAVDALIKIARKWAYVTKGIPNDEAIILTTDQCYHGLTLATMGLSNRIAQSMFVLKEFIFARFEPFFYHPKKSRMVQD